MAGAAALREIKRHRMDEEDMDDELAYLDGNGNDGDGAGGASNDGDDCYGDGRDESGFQPVSNPRKRRCAPPAGLGTPSLQASSALVAGVGGLGVSDHPAAELQYQVAPPDLRLYVTQRVYVRPRHLAEDCESQDMLQRPLLALVVETRSWGALVELAESLNIAGNVPLIARGTRLWAVSAGLVLAGTLDPVLDSMHAS